jgi:murein DD-endopeptidase MepM/ murein hydrolase activator NlpD
MKVYRADDEHQPRPVLRSLSPTAKSQRDSAESPIPAQFFDIPRTSQSSLLETVRNAIGIAPSSSLARVIARPVGIPVWAICVFAALLLVVPVVSLMTFSGGSDPTDETSVVESENESSGPEDLIDRFFEEHEPLVSEWTGREHPGVSARELYLLESGVNPDRLQVFFAAEEVQRLQAELEAIQRNSALLRSLTRQQSGDLSMAYSSLEATQEQKEGALEDLQERINELEERIELVDELARELRSVLGLPEPEGGVGGPAGAATLIDGEDIDPWMVLRGNIVSIEQRAGALIFDLDEVNTEIQLRLVRLQQTGLPRGSNVYDDLTFYDAMPLGWPVRGPITSRFGMRGSPFEPGVTEMHTGIDIAAPYGASVRATGSGTARIAGHYGGYGLLVVIDHGRGVSTWYGHNSRLRVSPGQSVRAGDVIADVGSTGRSTGPHVHYEVRIGNSSRDPLPLMQMDR